MKILKSKFLVFLALFFLANLTLVSAVDFPGDWKGYVTINSTTAPDGTSVVAATNASASAASTTVGAVEAGTGYYLIHVPGETSYTVTFKICGVTAYPSNNTPQTWSAGPHPQGSSPYYNISINTQANGAACTAACGCSGGYCNSGTCASSAPAAASTDTGSTGGTTISGTTGTTAVTTTPATVTPEKTVITDTSVINDLLSSLKPSDLGVASLDTSKVDVVKTGAVSGTTTATKATVESALTAATDEKAKQVLADIKEIISTSSSNAVQITTKLDVYNITSKETNRTSVVSKITLTIKADKDMKNVKLVEVIPKDVASSVANVVFRVQPVILQSDPIVQWTFDAIGKGETKDLSYIVNKKLDSIGTTALAAGENAVAPVQPPSQPVQPTQQPAQPAGKPDMTIVYALIAIIILTAIIIYFAIAKKKTKFGKK